MAGLGGISDLGGIDDLGGIGINEGGGGDAAHLTVHKEIVLGTTANRKVETWQGPYDRLLEKAKAYDIGKYVEDNDLPTGTSDTNASGVGYGYAFVSDARLTRDNGNAGRLVVTFTQNRARAFVSVDFAEVQRPIRTWKADAGSNEKPSLPLIRTWEAKKNAAPSEYESFQGLSGNTKKLAEMIFKGIETYSVYAPVVTVTLTTFSFPQLSLLPVGTVYGVPEIPYGWQEVHGRTISEIISNFEKPSSGSSREGYQWVLSSSKCSPNANGTYQWVLQYQACDEVEEVLFG